MSGAFLFGKMPAHGDFVARGLGAEARDSLDHWLSGEMDSAREALGEAFDERYDSAPPWRFALEEQGWTAGAMVPSVDSVGRRYPLMVARTALPASQVEAAGEACEDAIYAAFESGWSADELAAAAGTAALADGEDGVGEGWWTLGGEDYEPARRPGPRPANLLLDILGGGARAAA